MHRPLVSDERTASPHNPTELSGGYCTQRQDLFDRELQRCFRVECMSSVPRATSSVAPPKCGLLDDNKSLSCRARNDKK